MSKDPPKNSAEDRGADSAKDPATDSHANHPGNKTVVDRWIARLSRKLSLSGWLAIVAIPLGAIGALYLFAHEAQTPVTIYVPARELPAYYQIQSSDLIAKSYPARSVASDTLQTSQDITGRYTLTQIPQDKPLTAKQLGAKLNPTCLTDTIAVSLPAPPSITFGDTLKAGETISITFGSPATPGNVVSPPATFSNLLVLDVRAASPTNTPTNMASVPILVLALPKTAAEAFATHLAGATTLIGRDLSGKRNRCLI